LYLIPKILKITNITKTIFVDKNIKLGKTYKYQVIGIDSDGIPTKPSKEISVEVK
jgi:fibronectin type 3 domain-containing protein